MSWHKSGVQARGTNPVTKAGFPRLLSFTQAVNCLCFFRPNHLIGEAGLFRDISQGLAVSLERIPVGIADRVVRHHHVICCREQGVPLLPYHARFFFKARLRIAQGIRFGFGYGGEAAGAESMLSAQVRISIRSLGVSFHNKKGFTSIILVNPSKILVAGIGFEPMTFGL